MGGDQIAEVILMSNNSSTVRFHINFADKAIVGSKASFDKAGKGFGPIYEELARLMAKHPDYGFVVKVPEKRSAKPKQTYKGMDIAFIRDFLTANDDASTLKVVDDVIAYAKANKEHSYPLVKRVFLRTYDCLDYAEAKRLVADYRAEMKAAAGKALRAEIAAYKAKTAEAEIDAMVVEDATVAA